MRPKIIFKNVSKSYNLYKKQADKLLEVVSLKNDKNSFRALKDVSFRINEGEAIGIVGLNGSGKSTLSNLLAQVIPPSSGSIEINGETSLIAISAGLNSQLSGLENIELKCLMHGLKKEEIQELKSEIIEFAELGNFIDQPVKNYSSGMKSKLGFAISVHTNPDILIIDEALSVGDQTFYEKCLKKINEFKAQGKTIIFISHALGQIKNLCDRVMWIHFGKLEQFGDTKTVVQEYTEFIDWFNSLTEKEKKEYKKQMLESQYKGDSNPIEINPFGRQAYRQKKTPVKKKSNALFLLQCIVLFLAVVVSATFMFGANPVKSIGSYISDNFSKNPSQSDKEKVDKKDQEVAQQNTAEMVNKPGLVSAGTVVLYRDQKLRSTAGELAFADQIQVLEKIGETYKVQAENNRVGYTNAENITLLEADLPVAKSSITNFLPLFPERFSNAYSYFLTFLNSDSDEVISTLNGLTNEETLSNGKKTLSYSVYDALYTINKEDIAESITINNIDTNAEEWEMLKESASFTSNDEQYFYYVTKPFKIVIDTVNKRATVRENE
ncbi:teichoic acids export ABC transporter ATP-binding subunit TagH [Neobacillus vireti]|uniref:teichoic acids export ABC transporter ATP-binding subunit TagH n=1 Tax=Neobacillus vireti TaxID=220686 RepID=UPI002FFEC672